MEHTPAPRENSEIGPPCSSEAVYTLSPSGLTTRPLIPVRPVAVPPPHVSPSSGEPTQPIGVSAPPAPRENSAIDPFVSSFGEPEV